MAHEPPFMHALRLHGPGDLRWEEVPTPVPSGDEVLVRVGACVVDPDDLAAATRGLAPAVLPLTLGRGAAGVVVATGPDADEWQPGDRVAVHGARTCGRCPYCTTGRDNLCLAGGSLGRDRDGALAEQVLSDGRHLLPAPEGVAAATVAVAGRTAGVAYHALKRAGMGEGVTLAVLGLGGRGRHAAMLARLAGAEVIGVDTGEQRLAAAEDWGVEVVIDPTEGDVAARIREVTEGGVDASLELTGTPALLRPAVEALKPGGRATLTRTPQAALPPEVLARAIEHELDIVGAAEPTLQDLGELLDLLADGRLDLSRSVDREVRGPQLADLLVELGPQDRDLDTIVAAWDER